jgi:hypothetical protein
VASFARGAGKEHPAGCGRSRILSIWFQNHCSEDNRHVTIGNQDYVLSYDGYLMPAKKDQPPPDLKFFKQTKN